MYSTKTAVITTGSAYIPVGINDNVVLKEVNVNKSPSGLDFLEIVFEQNGATATMTEWKNTKSQWIKTDEELQNRDNLQFGRIMQILNCYYSEIEDVELNSFADMINWVKAKLTPMIATNKNLRLKVVYDNRGYTRVSSNGIFVEPMDVKESQIVLTGRDKLTKPEIKADVESSDPLATPSSTPEPVNPVKGVGDDLPF